MNNGQIELPVRYDPKSNQHILDARGQCIAQISTWLYNWPAQGGKDTDDITPAHGHAIGERIADAINENADLRRQLADAKALLVAVNRECTDIRKAIRSGECSDIVVIENSFFVIQETIREAVRCSSVMPSKQFPVQCTLPSGHKGPKHGGGGCEWTEPDDQRQAP